MKHKLIKTDNYLLVVDKSEIKKSYWIGYPNLKQFEPVQYLGGDLTGYEKKIIAHLPLNDSPVLEGVPLLPLLPSNEDDVEKIAEDSSDHFRYLDLHGYVGGFEFGAEWGYNKAREKYKFTEEDIAKALTYGWDLGCYHRLNTEEKLLKMQRDFIKSLSQSKMPTHFEFEIEAFDYEGQVIDFATEKGDYTEIKTTTNSQGQEVACGKYTY